MLDVAIFVVLQLNFVISAVWAGTVSRPCIWQLSACQHSLAGQKVDGIDDEVLDWSIINNLTPMCFNQICNISKRGTKKGGQQHLSEEEK